MIHIDGHGCNHLLIHRVELLYVLSHLLGFAAITVAIAHGRLIHSAYVLNSGIDTVYVIELRTYTLQLYLIDCVQAIDVATALAIYTSEHNSGVYKDKYITFSSRPQFVDMSKDTCLMEKIEHSKNHHEISNTNIEAVFDLILNIAVKYNIPSDAMIDNVLIISDMEFDASQSMGFYRSECNPLTKPLFEEIKKRYNYYGYQLPKLIFWNVNSRTKTIPLLENDLGVTLVSGFSQNVLKMVMSNKYDPYEVLIDTITSKRYDRVGI